MENFMHSFAGVIIPMSGMMVPILIVWIVNAYTTRDNKNKYDAIITVSQNLNNPEDIKELLESLKDKKTKSSLDLRRSGIVTIFVGIGLFFLGYFGLEHSIVWGVGLLVGFIGIGQMMAGYIYPNQSEEINKAVENFEKK
jgi:archaellum biogenesis protein FlaJ (TadC family)|tara:strand:- start:165 stop:584 length:420 start_codon:yes stop_codon:yes gene_type:complete